MRRWTNGLPGATARLGAKMALRGLSASQCRMRADTHPGPEQQCSTQRSDTLMQLSRSTAHRSPLRRTAGPYMLARNLQLCAGQSGSAPPGYIRHRFSRRSREHHRLRHQGSAPCFNLRMAEQKLHRPQVACAAIDQRRLGSAHRMRGELFGRDRCRRPTWIRGVHTVAWSRARFGSRRPGNKYSLGLRSVMRR